MTAPTLITAPAIEPVTLAEMKDHIYFEEEGQNERLRDNIVSARRQVERLTNRQLITATWEVKYDKFPTSFRVPLPPLQSVTFIKYIDTDGAEQTLASSVYDVDTDSEPGRITLAYDQSWAATRVQANAVTLRFLAGYGDAASDVPMPLREAVRVIAADAFNNREAIIIGITTSRLDEYVNRLLGTEALPEFV